MTTVGTLEVVSRACEAAFGKPLVTNVLRSQLVEAMIALALEPEWSWCGADYASWDFERSDGIRLEAKQSSYRQTWDPPAHGRISPSFDIKTRSGRWEGATFVRAPGRAADIYVFAYHEIRDHLADHRDPQQWLFYVVPTSELPDTKKLGLPKLRRLAQPVGIERLREIVADRASSIKPR